MLGRTNETFPSVWLSLSAAQGSFEDGWADRLARSAVEQGTVVDVSSNPALWGGAIRGTDATIMTMGGLDIERATDERHAGDLVQAQLLEHLSAIGREHVDFYFLRVRRALEEYQIHGALKSLEMGRQEGHIRFVGLCCDGPSLAVLGTWQFHDAFDTVLIPRNHYDTSAYDTLSPMARERRVGVVTSRPLNWGHGLPFLSLPSLWRLRNLTQSFYGETLAQAVIADLAKDHPVLVGVRTPEEIRLAVEAPSKVQPEGLDAFLQPYKDAWENDEEWREMAASEDATLRRAAERRAVALR